MKSFYLVFMTLLVTVFADHHHHHDDWCSSMKNTCDRCKHECHHHDHLRRQLQPLNITECLYKVDDLVQCWSSIDD